MQFLSLPLLPHKATHLHTSQLWAAYPTLPEPHPRASSLRHLTWSYFQLMRARPAHRH